MSLERRQLWEERHRAGTAGSPEPSLIEVLPMLPRGLALDLASGLGRHAIALAEAGHRVIGADYSSTAAAKLRSAALERRLPIFPVVTDVEAGWPFRSGSFDTVINLAFLYRPLVSRLIDALRPGGMLLFDTFLIDQAATGHPNNPAFMLHRGELREMLSAMELLRYREGMVTYPNGSTAWRAMALARRS
jgi:SAM-dependent methyltransferase